MLFAEPDKSSVWKDGTVQYSDEQTVHFADLSNITLYPNPANDMAYVELAPFEGEAVAITLANQLGRDIRTVPVDKADNLPVEISLEGLENGFYVVRFVSASGLQATKKLIVNHSE